MASIKCANCKQTHGSVDEVKACFAGQGTVATATPAAPQHRTWFDAVGVSTTRGYAVPATEAQLSFIHSLLAKVDLPVAGKDVAEATLLERAFDVMGHKDISKAEASDLITYLKALPVKTAAAAPVATGGSYPNVPAGHYAVTSLTGNNDLDFFRVDRPTEGQWAGRTFVKRIVGGKPEFPVRGAQARAALEAILAAGPEKAARLYGQEIGRCSRCNRHLTDETSREAGMGPECRSK